MAQGVDGDEAPSGSCTEDAQVSAQRKPEQLIVYELCAEQTAPEIGFSQCRGGWALRWHCVSGQISVGCTVSGDSTFETQCLVHPGEPW